MSRNRRFSARDRSIRPDLFTSATGGGWSRFLTASKPARYAAWASCLRNSTPKVGEPIHLRTALSLSYHSQNGSTHGRDLRTGFSRALIRHALASETSIPVALLVRWFAIAVQGRRIQNRSGLLHGAASGAALPSLVCGEAGRPAGVGLVRYFGAPQMHKMRYG
jgi:hypothetical protein